MSPPPAALICTLFGAVSATLPFIIIPYLNRWNPSGCTLGVIAGCIAALNIFGFYFLLKRSADYGQWPTALGLLGNGLSLLMIAGLSAVYIYFQYYFRM
ncbi:MAG: hypothetical protein SD837_11855 [Candidatus Electrothrix scaldis]|nr:MAG: hypothetical protein SD837_11855 [Candidatus Electrothrix sp. GW3-3]